jgi:hypothetical protein
VSAGQLKSKLCVNSQEFANAVLLIVQQQLASDACSDEQHILVQGSAGLQRWHEGFESHVAMTEHGALGLLPEQVACGARSNKGQTASVVNGGQQGN